MPPCAAPGRLGRWTSRTALTVVTPGAPTVPLEMAAEGARVHRAREGARPAGPTAPLPDGALRVRRAAAMVARSTVARVTRPAARTPRAVRAEARTGGRPRLVGRRRVAPARPAVPEAPGSSGPGTSEAAARTPTGPADRARTAPVGRHRLAGAERLTSAVAAAATMDGVRKPPVRDWPARRTSRPCPRASTPTSCIVPREPSCAVCRRTSPRSLRHLVVAGQLIEDDPELAYAHAEAARRRAARLPIVREAAAETAYAAGRYAVALSEFRALRRMTGITTTCR